MRKITASVFAIFISILAFQGSMLILLEPNNLYSQGKKVTSYTEDTSPTSDDITYLVNDPGGTPAPRKATLSNITKGLANFSGDAGSGGVKGLVPAPAAGDTAAGKYLKANGSWTTPPDVGITSLNALTGTTQTFSTGTTGSDFGISSSGTTHTFNIPDASASNRGVVTTGTQTFAGAKTFSGNLSAPQVTFSGANLSKIAVGTGGDISFYDYYANEKLSLSTYTGLPNLFRTGPLGVNLGASNPGAQFHVKANSSSTIGQIITAAASQTANLFEVNSSSGSDGDLFKIASTGSVTLPNAATINLANASASSIIDDGNITLVEGGAYYTFSSGGLLSFVGRTSSYPAIKRSGTGLQVRLADDSADAPVSASTGTFSGLVTVPAAANQNANSIGSSQNVGLAFRGSPFYEFGVNMYGTNTMNFTIDGLTSHSDVRLMWDSASRGTGWSNTIDVGLARDAAGVLRVDNGSTGQAKLLVGPSSATAGAQAHVIAADASTVGQIIQLAATPTANALEVNSSSGSGGDLAKIEADGDLDVAGEIRFGTNNHRIVDSGSSSVDMYFGGNMMQYHSSSGLSIPRGVYVTAASPGETVSFLKTTATNDDPVVDLSQGRVATTDATVTTIRTIPITASRTYRIHAEVVARRTGGASGTADDGATYTREWAFTTKSAVVTQLGADATLFTAEDQAGWDVDANVSGTNVLIQVTGASGNDVTWHLSKCEVSYVGT